MKVVSNLLVALAVVYYAAAQDISEFLINLMSKDRTFNPPKHGKTLFMTQCFGHEYFQTYCIPLLLSWRHAYCGNIMLLQKNENTCNQDHIFVMLVQNIPHKILHFISSNANLFGKVELIQVPTDASIHSDTFEVIIKQ